MAVVFGGRVNTGGTVTRLYLGGIVRADGTVSPLGGYSVPKVTPPPVASGARVPHLDPFVGPFNVGVSTSATYESTSSPVTASWVARAGDPPSGAGTGSGQVNGGVGGTFGVTVSKANDTHPTVTITNTGSGPTAVTMKVDPTMEPPAPKRPAPGAGGTWDANTVLVAPDGVTAYNFYRLEWNGDRTALTCTRIVGPYNLTTNSGTGGGVRASGFKLEAGLIRKQDIDKVLAGERTDFGHALVVSIPKEHLGGPEPMYVAPANTRDNQTNVPYSGVIPMGSFFAIPPATDAAAAESTLLLKAFANTLTRYGVYVGDQSSTWALYVDQSVSSTTKDALKTAWRQRLMGKCRRVSSTNSEAVGWGGGPDPRLAADPLPFA